MNFKLELWAFEGPYVLNASLITNPLQIDQLIQSNWNTT